ncbi:anti-sigma factor antagonist [Pseudoflavonifractor sp. 524-17]|uniref:STAS domain-containing protein n=1 Tax=Pseudoflavonifractor sp. 524-17 TaxID=2304577 RepID=UPI00137B3E38|nr:STAS domain-containing protein [Pseudoflavonifractor sp. 524-17]NCE65248.1 anti-sigma factor antagonist [Pseudoflavonifractor sp. 524-17]
MGVTCTEEGRRMTIQISGEVDHHRAKEIMTELERAVEAGLPRQLTLDLSGVTFMDSSGIAVLLRTYRQLAGLGGAMEVAGVPPQAGKVLKAAGLERLMPLEYKD